MPSRSQLRRPRLGGEAGIYLSEIMVSVTMMSVMVLGLTTLLIVQARQMTRDKLLGDMYTYAEMIMDEAAASLGTAVEVERTGVTGGRAREELEFQFTGAQNFGRSMETRFSKEGERKLAVRKDQVQANWSQRFPPPELDPDRNRRLNYRIRVKDFRFLSYNDRPFINPRVGNILYEAILVLELEDEGSDYKIQREFRRVSAVPNKHISRGRLQQVSDL
jgi:hypothetical protein